MIVNIYMDSKGNLINALVDEVTSHRPGQIIDVENCDNQKIITNIQSKECIDYGVIIYINKLHDHNNLVDDKPDFTISRGELIEVQTSE